MCEENKKLSNPDFFNDIPKRPLFSSKKAIKAVKTTKIYNIISEQLNLKVDNGVERNFAV